MTNSRESTSIIISMPPGKMLFVVISRSLCECHMKAHPASEPGSFAIVPEGGTSTAWLFPREAASGPRYGLPLYQAPMAKMLGSGKVTGPPLATLPNGAFSTGLLWSWHHSKRSEEHTSELQS